MQYICSFLRFPALQIQAGWSYAEDVNLLVSGYNRPEKGNAGSGIYIGNDIYLHINFYGDFSERKIPRLLILTSDCQPE